MLRRLDDRTGGCIPAARIEPRAFAVIDRMGAVRIAAIVADCCTMARFGFHLTRKLVLHEACAKMSGSDPVRPDFFMKAEVRVHQAP